MTDTTITVSSPAACGDVIMYLLVDGERFDVVGCLDNTCTLREPLFLPPCEAELVIIDDGVDRRQTVCFPDGIAASTGLRTVRFAVDRAQMQYRSARR